MFIIDYFTFLSHSNFTPCKSVMTISLRIIFFIFFQYLNSDVVPIQACCAHALYILCLSLSFPKPELYFILILKIFILHIYFYRLLFNLLNKYLYISFDYLHFNSLRKKNEEEKKAQLTEKY